MTQTRPFLSGSMKLRFEALQNCLVPRSQKFTRNESVRSTLLINELLHQQTVSSRNMLALFIMLIDLFSCIRYARSFRHLNAAKKKAVLNFFFDAPISLLRKGFWGLNTLARLGVYGQTELHDEIGYHLRENEG